MRATLLGCLLCAGLLRAAELDQLFAQRRYIELAEALDGSMQLSPVDDAYFRGLLANRRNAPADSLARLEGILPQLEAGTNMARLKIAYYILADNYAKTFRYADAARIYRKIDQRFGPSLEPDERRDVRDSLRKWEAIRRAGPQTVSVAAPFRLARTKDDTGILTVPVLFGDRTISCVFDTGANYSVLIRSLAQALRIPISQATIPVNAITGGEVLAHLAVVPEFRLGGAVVRQAIFLIFEDRDLYIAPIQPQIQGIIGVPVISALGRITFDPGGEIEIGASSAGPAGSAANLYLEERTPLVEAVADGQALLFTLDSGATKSDLFFPYFQMHRADFPGEPTAHASTGAGGTRSIRAYTRESLELRLGDKAVRLSDVPVYAETLGTGHDRFYGNLGQDVLKQFDRYTLDFRAMRLEVE